MSDFLQQCPICNREIEFSDRFPNYVCSTCIEHATDATGETVIFYHSRFNGSGYQGYYRRNNELIPFAGNTCYIKGVKCHAMNNYEGGVAIEPLHEHATATHNVQRLHAFPNGMHEKMQTS